MKLDDLKTFTQHQLSVFAKAEAGREYLVIVPHGWGRDPRALTAFRRARSNGCYYGPGTNHAVVYDAPAGAYLSGLGDTICWPDEKAEPPRVIGKVAFKK